MQYVYFRQNPKEAQSVDVQKLRSSNFNSSHPTKLIIHGYNSDMDLDVLVDIRKGESLSTGSEVFQSVLKLC